MYAFGLIFEELNNLLLIKFIEMLKTNILSKCILTLLLTTGFVAANAQDYKLTKVWETDSVLKVPESVLYYAKENILFVSNIDGKSNEKDLKGSISKLGLNGKIINQNWAINLSAPKGMGIFNDLLYVADLTEVVSIDLKTGKVKNRYPVEGSVFLNDITINKTGIIYVSDSRTGKVHQLAGDKVTTYLENQAGINGLLAVEDDLYLLVKGALLKADKTKNLIKVAEGMNESTDGIEQTTDKNFIVSCWNGVIYYVKTDGTKQELLDTRPIKLSTADIGYNAKQKIIYVPTFFGNKVTAYKLSTK